ncbi:MAG: ribosome silencing factor [Bacteroidales bacterium]|nr:ribosome silencing factor [Bacteroidales bacterium]MBR5092686.1 ribosome silencing factor [Bacteroidales bacterium]
MNNKEKESQVLARLAAQALDGKKAEEVRILDLRKVHGAPAEYFVIASGNVPSHVSALSDTVFEVVKKATGLNPHKVEGYNNAEWILMDYFDVVVHIFQKEKRAFYRLDELWSDGEELPISTKE